MTKEHGFNPIKNVPPPRELLEQLEVACSQAGLSASGAQLLHHYANAVWLLPVYPAIVRVTDSTTAHRKAQINVTICQWLVEQHSFPATAPLTINVVTLDAGAAATFWKYYPQPSGADLNSAHLGALLQRLHALPQPPLDLPKWHALTGLELVLNDTTHPIAVNDQDRRWLLQRIEQIRDEISQLDWPLGYGLIHGDAWAGNLMWNTFTTPSTVVLGDWDSTSWGPREVDLIPSWHAAMRYGRGTEWAAAFATAYGYDLKRWPGFSTMFAMRDLVQLVALLRRVPRRPELAGALWQRLGSIKAGDTTTVWRAY